MLPFVKVIGKESGDMLEVVSKTLDQVVVFSPQSGRQHKAWGVSPRIKNQNLVEPAKAGDSPLCLGVNPYDAAAARSAGLVHFSQRDPGADAQALC